MSQMNIERPTDADLTLDGESPLII